ncbi:MAG: histidine phosphatase family protein [Acidimicrobiia bacterium]|nr:histidine phosphatase family protein [Acidimicrobiia bacterium]
MPIYLVRHAHAGSRDAWVAPDADRHLSDQGWGRAHEIADTLASVGITEVRSSPLVRCVETMEPLAAALGIEVGDDEALREGATLAAGVVLVERLAADGTIAALCSHGDIIPDLLAALARRGARLDPGGACPKGSIWILRTHDGSVTEAVYAGKGGLPIG